MVGQFKCFINNVELTESPAGWDSLVLTLRNDSELRGLFKLFDVSLSFYADGYTALKSIYDTDGFTGSATFEAREFNDTANAYLPLYTGIIFMKDLVFYSGINGEYIKTQVTDNGLFARIRNNRNLKAMIFVGKSKNGVTITPCPYQKIEYFSCVTGSTYGTFVGPGQDRNNTAFRVYDLLKYFIDYMSDGEMDFISTTFDTGGLYSDYLITNGYLLRFVQIGNITQDLFEANWKELDFSTVFVELNKQFNLGFITGYNGSRPFIKIEARQLLYTNSISAHLPDVDKIEQRTATEYLFAKLIVGSEVTTNEPTLTTFPYNTRFVGPKKEEYVVLGESNIDRDLDLVNNWIVDTNTIEMLIEYGGSSAPTTYDEDVFLINATYISGTSWAAVSSNWLTGSATPVYYNELLNNNNKVTRYYGSIPNSIGLQLGSANNKFSAKSPTQYDEFISNPGVFNPADYSIVLSDPSGNYYPGGYYFQAVDAGVHTFQVSGLYSSFGSGVCAPYFDVFVDVYASTDIPGIDPPLYSTNISPYDGTTTTVNCINVPFILSTSVNLAAVDKVAIRIITYLGNWILKGSIFSCTVTPDAGGTYKTFDPTKMNVERSLFESPVTQDQFAAIETNNTDLIQFNVNRGKDKFGWIEEIKYKPFKRTANFTLISNSYINK